MPSPKTKAMQYGSNSRALRAQIANALDTFPWVKAKIKIVIKLQNMETPYCNENTS